ncbi:hypothetical protein COB80_02185, partial [Candidatus Kaiserbacteria bacterium]
MASLALVALGLGSFSVILWVCIVEAYSSDSGLMTLAALILWAAITWYVVFLAFFTEDGLKKGVLKKALTTVFLLPTVLFVAFQGALPPYEVQSGHVRISETGKVFTEGDMVSRTVFRLSSTDVDLTTFSGPWQRHDLEYVFRGPAEVRIAVT